MIENFKNVKHKEYAEYLPIWEQIDDVLAGERGVKAKGALYLPKPNPNDLSEANDIRYKQYAKRALFFNATGRTVSALVGSVFRKKPYIELPDSIAYAYNNIDGNGVGIAQQSQSVVKNVLSKGRTGLLVDFPAVDGDITVARARQENLQPYCIQYDAKNIVNWITERHGAITILKTIVLQEEIEQFLDILQTETIQQYRVLYIDDEGYYSQYVYQVDDQLKVTDVEIIEPRDANGNRLNFIPFVFVGSENNDYTIDDSPVYDLSNVNLSHYRNSADNEESSFIVGQPSLFLYVSNGAAVLEQNPDGIKVGSRAANMLGADDRAELLQANANNLPRENMRDKESMMVMLGARLVTPSQQETAEAARIKRSGDHSILGIIVKNVDNAYAQVIEWMQLFQSGVEDEFVFQVNNDFFFEKMTPQDRQAWLMDIQQGVISVNDYRKALREGGLLADERTDDMIEDELNDQPPAGII